jgi:hypothetical protein
MKTVILKLTNACEAQYANLQKNIGFLDSKNMYKLINTLNLDANPREARGSKVTSSIIETLEYSPELFMYKSKGILISTSNAEPLDRNRFRLSFDNPELEGLLDGGHNTFAIAKYMITCIDEEVGKKVTRWSNLKEHWDLVKQDIASSVESETDTSINNFLVPIEIISPLENKEDFFSENIFEISSARNNNAELTLATKANHEGLFTILESKLDHAIVNEVEWKAHSGGRIKVQDIVSLSLIPLIFLQQEGLLPNDLPKMNPIILYSSKTKCVEYFVKMMKHEELVDKNNEIINPLFESALSLMQDIPKLFDILYRDFPIAYNRNSSRFGGISSVKIYSTTDTGDKYISKKPKTKFYNDELDQYKYPDGFIYPLITALTQLMVVKDNELVWATDPFKYVEKNLTSDIEKYYISLIKALDYNPQQIGKNEGAYRAMAGAIELNIMKLRLEGKIQ